MDPDLEAASLRTRIANLERENAYLLKRQTLLHDRLEAAKTTLLGLRVAALEYEQARDKAQRLRALNDAASVSSKGQSGLGHHTPSVVIDAVSAWRMKAIEVAELALKETK